jgi:hypothetical protein
LSGHIPCEHELARSSFLDCRVGGTVRPLE